MASKWEQLVYWVRQQDDLSWTQRRFVDGEIHCRLFGIERCGWFDGKSSDLGPLCKRAWPAECGDFAQRNNDLPYEPCGAGLHGISLNGVWLDRAPAYTGKFSPKEVAAMLEAIGSRVP